jgi:hypothetical protein
MNIFLAIGHSTSDPGAVANNTQEHTEVKNIVQRVYYALLIRGLQVIKIPEEYDLAQQIQAINTLGTKEDVVFNIHMNAGVATASGVQVFYYGGSADSKKRAQEMLPILVSTTGLPSAEATADTDSRWGRLGIIRDTTPWAFLIELGFISNPSDLATVRRTGATALLQVILQYVRQYGNGNTDIFSSSLYADLQTSSQGMTMIVEKYQQLVSLEDQYVQQNKIMKDGIEKLLRKRDALQKEDIAILLKQMESVPDVSQQIIATRSSLSQQLQEEKEHVQKILLSSGG